MITVQLQEADYVSAVRLHRRWDTKMWSIVIGGVGCYLVAGLFMLIFAPAEQKFWAYVLFGTAIFLSALMAWMQIWGIPRGVRQRFKQNKALARSYDIGWNDEKLTVDGDDLHAGIKWTDFIRWREDDSLFLIYSGRILFRIIPKRCFPDGAGIAEFSRLLSEKIGPQGVVRK